MSYMNKAKVREGYKAFKKGTLACPYEENTTRAREWVFGFNRAYFDNLERVKKREQKENKSGRGGQAVYPEA